MTSTRKPAGPKPSYNERLGNIRNRYQGPHDRVLCVCSAGLLRSPTAALVLSQPPFNFNTRSVGLEPYALIPIDTILVMWADTIVCFDAIQETTLLEWYGDLIVHKQIKNFHIDDNYEYRNEDLQEMIRRQALVWWPEVQAVDPAE